MLPEVMLIFKYHFNVMLNVILTCIAQCHTAVAKSYLNKKMLPADSPYTSFCEQGNGCLMIQMPQGHRFLSRELPILCKL